VRRINDCINQPSSEKAGYRPPRRLILPEFDANHSRPAIGDGVEYLRVYFATHPANPPTALFVCLFDAAEILHIGIEARCRP
jgi:hypothetical protein